MIVEVARSGAVVQVDAVCDDVLLDLASEAELWSREADRRKLRYALAWATRHIVTDPDEAVTWSECGDRDTRGVEETLGGPGTPLIATGSVEPFAAALGTTVRAAMGWLSDSLDLTYRLPLLAAAVEDLKVAPWRARRIAQATTHLSLEAAAHVDAHLVPIADSVGAARIDRLVTEAAARFDPPAHAQVEDEAHAAWGVRLDHYQSQTWAGTSRLEITGDTPTLTAFHDLICGTAHTLLDPGLPADYQPSLEHRKITALGLIADGTGATTITKAFLHFTTTDVTAFPDSPLTTAVGTVEKLGPLTLARTKAWLEGTARFTITPVLDLRRTDAVDHHDPPPWMRELVYQRDPTCVFAYCDKPSRDCDLDHIEAYIATDDGGPPGQTHPGNLAPLCRRHHRAKTFHGWTYTRNRDDTYTWTAPRGTSYTVDPRGIVTRH